MKKHYSIVFPNIPTTSLLVYTYETGMRRFISLKEAKDILLGALLRGDMVMLDEKSGLDEIGAIITVVDKAEWARVAAEEFASRKQAQS